MRALAARTQEDLRQSRLISTDIFKLKIEITIYGNNKVNIVSFQEKFALIIESSDIHDSLKSIFETMWVMASK